MNYNVKELIALWWYTPANEGFGPPILFTGSPGEAKSGFMKSVAQEFCVPFLYVDPLAKGEGYSGAVPVIDEVISKQSDGEIYMTSGHKPGIIGSHPKILRFPPNEAIFRMAQNGRGFIGVDEIRNCPVTWQQTLQALFEAREFGDQKLPVGVRLLACSNSAKVATGGRRLSGPLANRFTHVAWHGFTPEQTLEYLLRTSDTLFPQAEAPDLSKPYPGEKIEEFIRDNWKRVFNQVAIDVFGGFLRAHSGLQHVEPAPNSPDMDGAWPTTRTWTQAARWMATHALLTEYGLKISKDVLGIAVEGCIGEDASMQFSEYMRKRNLPSPEDFLMGRTAFQMSAANPDAAYTVMASAANFVLSGAGEAQGSMAERLYEKCTEALKTVGVEIALVGAQPLSQNGIVRHSAAQTSWQKAFMNSGAAR